MTLLELLNLETGAPVETLLKIISTAPRRYKVYEIPKRNGGTRTIAHPARELKTLQHVILREILDKIAVSEIATAYVRGRGIVFNAKIHLEQRWIMKLDFKNFFHSIVPSDWDRIVRRTVELRQFSREGEIFHRILYWGAGEKQPRCLSIGAPTSPSVSNLACLRLDQWMIDQARKLDVRVTRYADDITISADGPAKLVRFERLLEAALNSNKGISLCLNEKKRGVYGPGERRMVTGLVLTPNGDISIGRGRKRAISAMVHQFSLGKLDADGAMRAKGLLAFAISAEPSFFSSIKHKYGDMLIGELMKIGPDTGFESLDVEF
jgi:RNA-directed DNA polymerase